jgi:hypothetical protein
MGDRHKQPSSHLRLRGDAFHILRHPLVVRARSETHHELGYGDLW